LKAINGKLTARQTPNKQRERKEKARRRAANAKAQIVRDSNAHAQIVQDSATPLDENISDHWKMLLDAFNLGMVVWIGSTYDSGKVEHQKNFRT